MVKEIQGARPVGITVEEFGMATFEAIQAATARDQARKAAAVYAAKGLARMAHDATLRALAADERLRELLKAETVKGEDVRKILSMADQAR
jgi:hypothetical protein